MNPSNFELNVTSAGKEKLAGVVALLDFLPLKYFRMIGKQSVELAYSDSRSFDEDKEMPPFSPLPYELKDDAAIHQFIWSWLAGEKPAENSEPDHDGSNGTGFQIKASRNNIRVWRVWAEYWK